jgi:hypothetical protein
MAGFNKSFKSLKLLKDGKIGYGKLMSKEATNTKINNRIVYKMIFEFQTQEKQIYKAIAHTNMPELLEDEHLEQVLYLPEQPTYAMMLDEMTGSPRLDKEDRLIAPPLKSTLAYLILPTIVSSELLLTIISLL